MRAELARGGEALLGTKQSQCRRRVFGVCLLGAILLTFGLLFFPQLFFADPRSKQGSASTAPGVRTPGLPGHLSGVNLGGWLCLEDWFYSGDSGVHVSSVDEAGQGACLPPALTQLDKPWPSEGHLTYRLNQTKGTNFTIKALTAHRHSFIGEIDLAAIRELGLSVVRVPITWAAFADALVPLDQKVYGSHNPRNETVIVPDPFYNDRAAFATIPRNWLAQLLRRCAEHGLRVLIDLHAFPGGSSLGTYNGVWPDKPAFWRNQTKIGQQDLTQVGLWIVGSAVTWLEGLDLEAQAGLLGLTVMNEPAHLNSGAKFAEEAEILKWLANAAQIFRLSKLPSLGVKLYMQMIDTAFQNFTETVVPWFSETFTETERLSWVVADQHWYTAWDSGNCDMRTSEDGGLTCDAPLETIRRKMRSCATAFSTKFNSQFGGLMAVSEFSAGTAEAARFACTDRAVLRVYLQEQLSAWDEVGLQGFFWTWRMPYGRVFEP
ncbi:EXG1, partial [Symbiodinium pilosum]